MSEQVDTDVNNRSRERDRSRRVEKNNRPSDGNRERSRDTRGGHKVFVSNICYEYRWQQLKDLFRDEVGDVVRVELFVDENDKPRGCGLIEFADAAAVKKCMSVMHRYDLKGRKLVVRDDSHNVRDKFGNIVNGRRGGDRDDLPDLREDHLRMDRMMPPQLMDKPIEMRGNTYGLSPQFLEELEIRGPLLNRVFIANLDYKVDDAKLREVFKLAGKVLNIELARDKDGNSRGFAVIEYDHPVECVQAISMFHGQQLYDRKLIVRMDREKAEGLTKLPEGLRGIGLGLGPNGDPLRDVSRNLPNSGGNDNCGNNSLLGNVPAQALQSLGHAGLSGTNAIQAAAIQSQLLNPILAGGLGNVANELALAANLGGGGLNASLVSNSLNSNAFRGLGGSGNSFKFEPNMNQAGRSNFDSIYSSVNNGSSRNIDGNGGNVRVTDTIMVSNLPPTASWTSLREKFRTFGDILACEMKGADVSLIKFANQRSAKQAVEVMDRARLDGRTIDVRFF